MRARDLAFLLIKAPTPTRPAPKTAKFLPSEAVEFFRSFVALARSFLANLSPLESNLVAMLILMPILDSFYLSIDQLGIAI